MFDLPRCEGKHSTEWPWAKKKKNKDNPIYSAVSRGVHAAGKGKPQSRTHASRAAIVR